MARSQVPELQQYGPDIAVGGRSFSKRPPEIRSSSTMGVFVLGTPNKNHRHYVRRWQALRENWGASSSLNKGTKWPPNPA
jgi:hypothetical protein